jgi:hypothetical protein
MHTRIPRITALAFVLLVALLLAACAGQAQPAPQPASPAPQLEATTAPTVAPTATEAPTVAPTATTVPSPTPAPTPIPSPTPAPSPVPQASMPDAKADPKAALVYSASAKGLRSATFTYQMTMTMAPADDASTNALGAAAAMLSNLAIKASGTGAMQVVDAAKGQANVRMDINTDAMGQKILVQTITVSGTTWTRVGTDGAWQKADVKTGGTIAKTQTGVDPSSMFLAFDGATDVKWLDDNPLKGKPVHHLSFSIDPAKLNLAGVIQNGQNGKATPEELQAMMKIMTINAEAWLGADDLLPRQEKLTLGWVMPLPGNAGVSANLKVGMDTLMVFDKLNQPVEIKAPAE